MPGAWQGILKSRRVFLELGYFNKQSSTTQKRKFRAGKYLRFFPLETLKNCTLNEKFQLKITTIRAFFSSKLGHFIPVPEKRENLPPPFSSSSASDCICLLKLENLTKTQLKCLFQNSRKRKVSKIYKNRNVSKASFKRFPEIFEMRGN